MRKIEKVVSQIEKVGNFKVYYVIQLIIALFSGVCLTQFCDFERFSSPLCINSMILRTFT